METTLPQEIMRLTNIWDNMRLAVKVIEADALQFTPDGWGINGVGRGS